MGDSERIAAACRGEDLARLASRGQRDALASLLPPGGPLTLPQADAWLEAALPDELEPGWTARIVPGTDDQLPPAGGAAWVNLLEAETQLACGGDPEAIERALVRIGAQTPHIGTRAVAALARARLAQWREPGDVLTSAEAAALPEWERHYLEALFCWQAGATHAALAALEAALTANPAQTPVRLALAARLAPDAPERALEVVTIDRPTRQICVARTALLARLGRFDEAEQALALAAPHEPARYTWAAGRREWRRQECALRTALAERRGEWSAAAASWRLGCGGTKSLEGARQLFMDCRELESMRGGKGWRRSQVAHRMDRAWHELGNLPLSGDSMFFRAPGFLDRDPARAARDFRALLRQRAWLEAERAAGGGRLVYAGDALLGLGQSEEAVRAYENAGAAPERLAERLAAARMLMKLAAAEDPPAAQAVLDAAERQRAPAALCALLRRLVSGGTVPDAELETLRLPRETRAALRLVCGEGPEIARIKEFIKAAGERWPERCPADPQLAARRALGACCDDGKWDEALELAASLERRGRPWALELAALTRLRHALSRALGGQLEEAAQELQRLQASLPQEGQD